jgi:hypothetical protein
VFAVLKNTGDHNSVTFETILLDPKRDINKLSIGDLDGDEYPDLVTSDEFDEQLDIRRDMSTEARIQFSDPEGVFFQNNIIISTRVTDVNNDGKADIMMLSGNGLTVLKNRSVSGRINFSAPRILSDDRLFTELIMPPIVEDMDGDGLPEILAREEEDFIMIENLSNHDEIRFNERVHRFSIGRDSRIVILADMSGDNRQDIVCINQSGRDSDGAIIVLVRD